MLAVDKPAGLPFHPNLDLARDNLVDRLKAQLQLDYLGIHQRLDRDTSGVAVFSLAREANPGLAAAFEGRQVTKIYHALTVRPRALPAGPWEVANQLAVMGKKRQARTVAVTAGGQEARTQFRIMRTFREGLLVEARPRTGRKHQIRAHLAGCGMPLVGDPLYGGPPGPRVMLHARQLTLPHPLTGAELVLEAPYPADLAAYVG